MIFRRIFLPVTLLLCFHKLHAQYCLDDRFNVQLFDSTQIEKLFDIEYGEAVNVSGELQKLYLDIYRPMSELDDLEKKPLVVFVHGGGMTGGSKTSAGAVILGNYLTQRGFVYGSIDYRIGWDAMDYCQGDTVSLQYALYRALQDTRASIRFLKENADLYNIDTNYIFLAGNSVGSTLILYSAYAQEQNFPQYLYDALGSIDSSGNIFYDHTMNIKGVIAKAAGVEVTDIFENQNIPAIFFHGTCDAIVPYIEGNIYSCRNPAYPYYYGSWTMANIMKEKSIPFQLYTNEGEDHTAAEDDTVTVYAANFLKSILCDDLPSETYFYRFNNGGCIATSSEEFNVTYYPNPFQDHLNLEVKGGYNSDILLELFSYTGQIIYQYQLPFHPPQTNFSLELDSKTLSNGFYLMRLSGDGITKTIPLYKQN